MVILLEFTAQPRTLENQSGSPQKSAQFKVLSCSEGHVLGGPGSASRRIQESSDKLVYFLLCASNFHGSRAARRTRSLHEMILIECRADEHLLSFLHFVGLGT